MCIMHQDYPCGQCHECRASRQQDWITRLLDEAPYWPNAVFFTFTFDDDNLKEYYHDAKNKYKVFQNWLKRLRKTISPFKYFAVLEFGEITGRPHYHAILYFDTGTPEGICRTWSYGHTSYGRLTASRAKYIVKYVLKNDTRKPEIFVSRAKCSLGLGRRKGETYAHGTTTLTTGKKVCTPRYYINRCIRDPNVLTRIKNERQLFAAKKNVVKEKAIADYISNFISEPLMGVHYYGAEPGRPRPMPYNMRRDIAIYHLADQAEKQHETRSRIFGSGKWKHPLKSKL